MLYIIKAIGEIIKEFVFEKNKRRREYFNENGISSYMLFANVFPVVSLDKEAGEEREGYNLRDLVPDKNAYHQERFLEERELHHMIRELLSCLDNIERYVIINRFGIYSESDPKRGESETLESIGRAINRTRERVRQIEKQALEKMALYIRKNRRFGELRLYNKNKGEKYKI